MKTRQYLSGSSILLTVLGLIFILFSCWYDGWWITPLTTEEGETLYKALSGQRVNDQVESKINPNSVNVFAQTDDGQEFYMLNLIKDKKRNTNGKDIGAFESINENYASVAFPLLFQHGCHPIMVSNPLNTFSQPFIEEEWDAIFIIRYRSRRDLYDIVTNEEFQKAWEYKLSTIEKTTVIPSTPIIPGISLKWILGLILLTIGWIGHKIIQYRRRKKIEIK